jgi:NTP pyrophosphatase (non-canonical NTP hydrolase)
MKSLQADINRWQLKTFGMQGAWVAWKKLQGEVHELGELLESDAALGRIADELADVFVTLCGVALEVGVQLEPEVVTKMVVNRNRTWAKRGDGTFQHIPSNDDD